MNSLHFKISTFSCWLFLVAIIGPPLLQGAQPLFFEEGFRDFSSSWSVALGDLDNDGDLDAAMLGGIFVNDGNAGFTELHRFRYRGYWATGLAWGDFNHDGFEDLWVAQFPRREDGISDHVWINQKDGTLDSFTIGRDPSMDVALGDIDGDGDNDLDAWVAKGLESGNYYSNDGLGGFELKENAFSLAQNRGARDLVVEDINSDGFPDGLVARKAVRGAGGEIEFWVNRGSGKFRVAQVFGEGITYGIATGDLDGDGDLDAIVASAEGNSKVWLNRDFPLIKSIVWKDGFVEIDYAGKLYEGASPNGRFRSVKDATSPYKVRADSSSRFFLAR